MMVAIVAVVAAELSDDTTGFGVTVVQSLVVADWPADVEASEWPADCRCEGGVLRAGIDGWLLLETELAVVRGDGGTSGPGPWC